MGFFTPSQPAQGEAKCKATLEDEEDNITEANAGVFPFRKPGLGHDRAWSPDQTGYSLCSFNTMFSENHYP